jgi:hypothetical protein
MTFNRTLISIAVLASAALTTSVWAAAEAKTAAQGAQAQPTNPGMGMGMRAGAMSSNYAEQMKAMQQMHDKMFAAKTPEERNALMAEQMKLMQGGMTMMGGMGGMGAEKPADMAARQGMMEQRMDMMQMMMQMMMDRTPSAPATK